MERIDADQEGITLPPTSGARLVARDEAERAVDRHALNCPFAAARVEVRLRTLEISYARLLGFLLGSGILGGAAGGAVAKLLS